MHLLGFDQLGEAAAKQAIVMGDDELGADQRRVIGRMAVGHQDDALVQRGSAAAGRIDGHLGLHAGGEVGSCAPTSWYERTLERAARRV